ncbi:MAG: FkbM family methyltransferase [Bauldia sp.]|nr:FkbM family methyltransferase [Bauldia sp.]
MPSGGGRTQIPPRIAGAYKVAAIDVTVPGLPRPLKVRLHDTDPIVFEKIFIEGEYGHHLPDGVRVIVDAGANVGYSVAWFRIRFPDALIIAIEPDPANFALLVENCAHLPQVTLIEGALWPTEAKLGLQILDGAWGTRVFASPEGTVRGFSLDTIMRDFDLDAIDILKVDIEGAEKEVFETPGPWLDRTRCVIVETHERFRPGSEAAVRNALRKSAFAARRVGESDFYSRRDPSAAPMEDVDGEPETEPESPQSIWIVSDGRSGSTWLSGLVNHDRAFAEYFEPAHAAFNPVLSGEPLLRYIRRGAVPQAYLGLYQAVFGGFYRDQRSGPENAGRAAVLVKDIHCLMSARAISDQFPQVKVVCLVRHPLDVASSKLAMDAWVWLRDPLVLLQQDALAEDFLGPFRLLLEEAGTQVEKYVAIWCCQYFVFTQQFAGTDVAYVDYGSLRADAERVVTGLRGASRTGPEALDEAIGRPTWTSRSADLVGREPTPGEERYAARAIDRFGLADLLKRGSR